MAAQIWVFVYYLWFFALFKSPDDRNACISVLWMDKMRFGSKTAAFLCLVCGNGNGLCFSVAGGIFGNETNGFFFRRRREHKEPRRRQRTAKNKAANKEETNKKRTQRNQRKTPKRTPTQTQRHTQTHNRHTLNTQKWNFMKNENVKKLLKMELL